MLKILTLVTAALVALTIPLTAQDGGPVLRVDGGRDEIVHIRAKTRHTTVIVLPQTENVLDFVVGDSEYWHLTGAANLAFLKPIAEGVTTNVALVCESGRIYSFLVTEQSAGRPHLVVRIDPQGEADPRISPVKHEPAFVARGQVAAYQQMAETAIKTAKAAQMDADSRIADTAALGGGRERSVPGELSYAAQVSLPIGRQGAQVAVPGRGNVARRAVYLPSLERPGVARAVRRKRRETVARGLRPWRGRTVHRPSRFGPRLVADRQTESTVALRPAGDRAMIEWKRLYAKPAGSLPGGVVTQWGVGAITVFILLFLTYWIWLGGGEPAELPGATETATTAPRSFTDQMTARVDEETMRAETKRAAADRALRARQQQQANVAGVTAANQAALLAGPSPDTGQPYTQEEWQLRERLRLEAVERRSRSLRSSPVAQTYRKLDGSASGGKRIVDDPAPAKDEGAEALQHALDTMRTVTTGLEDEIAAEAQADQALIAALRGTPTTPEAAPAVPAATAGSATARDYSVAARVEAPQDPPGWERIHEGSFLEAALVTQLSGDFPGPVLAVVAVPFYSADRQRILVPRGTRIIGTAQAVTNQDQSRLGVGFHRLIYPDGRWVSLQFRGLNQLGEGALKDQVDRHYFSMFAAVGAVGVLSGLTSARGNPYEGGAAGFRANAGQGLGQAATRILDRFLNRLPNITIRAGHRLRVWFTSDVLVPRPTKGD